MSASLFARGYATAAYQAMGPTNGGNEIVRVFHYSCTASPSANDVYQMIKVPEGAVITGGWLMVDSDSAFTISVGDGADVDRYISGASVSASQTTHGFIRDLSGATSGLGHKYTADDTIDIKLTAVSGSKALDWTLCVKYVVDDQTGGVVSS